MTQAKMFLFVLVAGVCLVATGCVDCDCDEDVCIETDMRCDNEVTQACIDGDWRDVEDCSEINQECAHVPEIFGALCVDDASSCDNIICFDEPDNECASEDNLVIYYPNVCDPRIGSCIELSHEVVCDYGCVEQEINDVCATE